MISRSLRARRRSSWTAIQLAMAGLLVPLAAWSAPAEPDPTVWKPSETADAVLHAENVSWGRQLHDALRLPDWLDLAVDHRNRFEFLDDPWRPGESQKQTQIVQRSRIRIGVDAPGGIRLLGEFQDARIFNDRPNDFPNNGIDHLDVLQLFVSATQKDLLGRGLRADGHIGRLTIDVASRRLVARNDFRNTVNAFDGVHLQLGSDDRKLARAGLLHAAGRDPEQRPPERPALDAPPLLGHCVRGSPQSLAQARRL